MTENEIQFDIIMKQTQNFLKDHFFETMILKDRKEALSVLVEMIPKDAVIGFGGSKTLVDIGFFGHFTKLDYKNLLDRNDPALTYEEKKMIQIMAISSDYFVCSANAISSDGRLILIDKMGNRNAAATYGPKKRIFIAGRNKISFDADMSQEKKYLPVKAMNRAKNKASVLNNIRFDTKNPCTIKGYCSDCSGNNRLCGVTTIIERAFPAGSALVMLINEDLGF